MRLAAVLAALWACSCADRPSKTECEAMVEHVVKISGSKVSHADLAKRCAADLSRPDLACANAATSKADLEKCAGW